MTPTTKLVTDMVSCVPHLPQAPLKLNFNSMQACYVNTTHPDFIGGQKVCFFSLFSKFASLISSLQATAVVAERLNSAKGPPPNTDGKRDRTAINNNKDLEVDLKKEEQSFFGSFFTAKKDTKKKGAAAMEPPPPSIRPQSSLSERETMETEVISLFYFLFPPLVTYLIKP
jgi:hypothetical protein